MTNKLGLAAMAAMVMAVGTAQAGPITDTTPDGAKYQLQYSNVGSLYTFTFVADFTGVSSTPPLNQYAMAYSIASMPGSVDWTAGSNIQTPGSESNWGLFQGVVSNSNGCPGAGSAGKDWCAGLLNDGTQDGPLITNTSVLKFVTTMTLVAGSGTPDFNGDWSYKFVTTTGGFDAKKEEWEFGSYQISRTLTPCATGSTGCDLGDGDDVPVPDGGTTLTLLGTALVGVGALRRKFRV